MAETQITRRSARTRKPVTTFAEEQAVQQAITVAPPAKRKKVSADVEEDNPPAKKTKPSRVLPKQEFEYTAPIVAEPDANDEDFKSPPKKKTKKTTTKGKKAIGKVDSKGVMRLIVTTKRPPGERKPPQVWPVPERKNATKGKSFNLAAILAESFEDRRERQISKIRRLDEGETEKRLKTHVPHATDSYNKFLDRARTQRMFVLSRIQGTEEDCHANDEACPFHEVKLAGTTGNVYTVIISHLPTCNCPNTSFKRADSGEALCKHILYVLHFVLKAPEHLCYQNAFLTSELHEITANAPPLPTAKNIPIDDEQKPEEEFNRKPIEEDCPICCMEFQADEAIVWCRAACGNNVHKECFGLWAKAKRDNVTCPFCRSKWLDDNKPAKIGEQSATMLEVQMPANRSGGYYNVRDQLAYE
ncbi:hypothetical protein Q7P37_009166 [Cladosporium fusiforme]